jgi:hypothetical protein
MTKSEIYQIRGQVHGAMTNADRNKTQYSPLIRMEWKNYGYIPVSARHSDQYNPEFLGAQPPRAGQDY